MKNKVMRNRVETIGNGIALLLGLAFLGDLFGLWCFDPFDGWWVLFLYIPAVTGFLVNGVTAGGIMLTLTALVLTVGMFTDVDEKLWAVALMIYLAYLGFNSLRRKWNAPEEVHTGEEGAAHHEL